MPRMSTTMYCEAWSFAGESFSSRSREGEAVMEPLLRSGRLGSVTPAAPSLSSRLASVPPPTPANTRKIFKTLKLDSYQLGHNGYNVDADSLIFTSAFMTAALIVVDCIG